MTSIQAGISINNPNVKAIDTSTLKLFKVHEADEELYQRLIGGQEKFLKHLYTQHPDTSSHPSTKPYATVEVNGKTAATLDNSGGASSSSPFSGRIQKLLASDDSNLTGPDGAQDRAEKIAELLGGTVVKSSTAITMAQFNAMPALKGTVNYQAMKNDPLYEQLQKTKEARTLFLAQQLAQEELYKT